MKNKFVGILLMICMLLNMNVCIFASSGLSDKPDVTDFNYILKDKDGNIDSVITSGGSLEVSLTLENNTLARKPYVVMLQILNKGNKVSLTSAKGEIDPSDEENICLSDGFSLTETDFSNYSAEVYVWSDMNSMQPISTYSVLGSDNNDIYAYKIDNDLVYTNGSTSLSHYFPKTYSGTPRIRPVFYDLSARLAAAPLIGEVTTSKQYVNFKAVSYLGSLKDHYLEIYKVTDETDPKNADLKTALFSMVISGRYGYIGNLYPSFNKDITEYTIFTNAKAYAGVQPVFETVNSDATVALTTAPDTSLTDTSAVYTVTSADGTVTKDYKFNFHTVSSGTKLAVTNVRNGYLGSGSCYYSWNRGSKDLIIDDTATNKATFNGTKHEPVVIQDGTFSSSSGPKTVKDTRPIIEIDISAGPEIITHGIVALTKLININGASTGGTLKAYKINDSIYNTSFTDIAQSDIASYYGAELGSIPLGIETVDKGNTHCINIGADYYNSLKAAGRTKMYIGLAGEATDTSKAMGAVFGVYRNNGTQTDVLNFWCITE